MANCLINHLIFKLETCPWHDICESMLRYSPKTLNLHPCSRGESTNLHFSEAGTNAFFGILVSKPKTAVTVSCAHTVLISLYFFEGNQWEGCVCGGHDWDHWYLPGPTGWVHQKTSTDSKPLLLLPTVHLLSPNNRFHAVFTSTSIAQHRGLVKPTYPTVETLRTPHVPGSDFSCYLTLINCRTWCQHRTAPGTQLQTHHGGGRRVNLLFSNPNLLRVLTPSSPVFR